MFDLKKLLPFSFVKKNIIAEHCEIDNSQKHEHEQCNHIKNDELFKKLAFDFECAAQTPNQAPTMDRTQTDNQKTDINLDYEDYQNISEKGTYLGIYDVLTNENNVKSILGINANDICNYPVLKKIEEISIINLFEKNVPNSILTQVVQFDNENVAIDTNEDARNIIDFNSAPLRKIDNAVTLDTQISK